MKLRLVTQNGNSLIVNVTDLAVFVDDMRRTGPGEYAWLRFPEGMIRPSELDVVEVLPEHEEVPA